MPVHSSLGRGFEGECQKGKLTQEVVMFVRTIEPAEAEGEVASIYEAEIASAGKVMEATRCWTARPDILSPVEHL